MAKALAQKEMALAQKLSSVQKAPLRKGVTLGKGNYSPVTANLAPVTSRATTPPSTLTACVSTGALPVIPTLDQGMLMYYCCSQLTAPIGNGAPMAAVPLVPQDQNPAGTASELAVMCGEYSFCVRNKKKHFHFQNFLVQIAVMSHKLKVAQEAATSRCCTQGGRPQHQVQIPHPAKVGNLQEAMCIQGQRSDEKYHNFMVQFFFFLVKCTVTESCTLYSCSKNCPNVWLFWKD